MSNRIISVIVIFIGSLQLVGFVTNNSTIRGLGIATAASPLPFVFTQFRGVETFAAEFAVELIRTDGSSVRGILDADLYGRLGGPYNRRNVYGAAFAYGPALDRPAERRMVDDVLRYGFCAGGPLAIEFGEIQPIAAVVAETRSKTQGVTHTPWQRRVECDR